jgi:LuxR family transcriptional regulator, maltose regulon positive regulatory protein
MGGRATLAPSQIRAPDPAVVAIERAPILQSMLEADARGRRLCVVSAGAGWGKTTVLRQWHDALLARGVVTAWLSLAAGDEDPYRFWSGVLLTLEQAIRPGDPHRADRLRALAAPPGPEQAELVSALLEALHGAGPLLLVLDEVQHLSSPATVQGLRRFLLAASPDLRVAIGTRADLDIGAAKLIAEGRCLELRAADLAFDEEETRHLLRTLGFTRSLASDMHRVTGGWPVAVHLASYAMQGQEDPKRFLESFAAETRPMAEYLVSEVFDDLDPGLTSFLVDVCAPEEMTADLAFLLSGRPDAEALLVTLSQTNALVTTFGTDPPTFRLHALLRGYLKAEARKRDVSRQMARHAMASHWFLEHHLVKPAVEHALAAQDWELTRLVLERTGLQQLMAGGTAVVLAALQVMPLREQDSALTPLLRATAALLAGQPDQAGRALAAVPEEVVGERQLWATILRLWVARVRGTGPRRLGEDLASVENSEPASEDLHLLGVAVCGSWRLQMNDLPAAERNLQAALSAATATNRDLIALDCRARLCQVAAAQGNFDRVVQRSDDVIRFATARGWAGSPQLVGVHLLRAWMAWGLLDVAGTERFVGMAAAIPTASEPEVEASLRVLSAFAREARTGDRQRLRADMARWWAGLAPDDMSPVALSAYLTHEMARAATAPDRTWAIDVLDRAQHVLPDSPELEVLTGMRLTGIDQADAAAELLGDGSTSQAEHPLTATVGELLRAHLAHRRRRGPDSLRHLQNAMATTRRLQSLRPFTYVPAELLDLLDSWMGHFGPDDEIAARVLATLRSGSGHPAAQLTPRELMVLRALPTLLHVEDIAIEQGVSPNTIRTQVKQIYLKLGAHSRREAVKNARRLGLLDGESPRSRIPSSG